MNPMSRMGAIAMILFDSSQHHGNDPTDAGVGCTFPSE